MRAFFVRVDHSFLFSWKTLRTSIGSPIMSKPGFDGPLIRMNDVCWKIPRSYKEGMRVDGLIYASDELIDQVRHDQAPEQVANVATLPGIRLLGPRGARSGLVSFAFEDVHAHDVVTFADEDGVALRGAVRLDRDAPWTLVRASSPASGLECGAGAWLCPAHAMRVWVSAPQLACGGPAPPLVRPLECGVRLGESSAVWCTLRAPHDGDDGVRALGAALEFAPVLVWVELRDAPLRAATGLSLAVAGGTIAWRLDDHPVLGETVRLAIAWHGGGARP